MPAFAGMTRISLILAVLFWGLIPQGGLFAAQSDSIAIRVTVIDSAPQGSIVINNDEEYTISASVTLTLSAQDPEGNIDTMQFSNDGVIWSVPESYATSKIWDLSLGDGEKTVYVKFADTAGHWSQAYSDSIMLYEGTLIDPAIGGEVISPDGKAKLSIPPGAFGGGPRYIFLMLLDIDAVQDEIPTNYKLRVIVECQPEGLIFFDGKWPTLSLTLGEAEVPGTPIELGYRISNRIELAEEPPVPVLSDSITVEFLINHFSTYAGLSSMLSQGAPIGAGVKIPLPDMLTGAFGHSIGITVPPGRKGMQPNINLQYRSSNPNSWCGFGWSLNPGYIVRSTKLGPPTYDDAIDTFIFVTDSGSTELVHLIDNLYQAKIESAFAKFYKETDDTWKVVQKDGTILNFGEGEGADSKETSSSGTFLWNLTKVIDNNGNYIALNYKKYPYDQNDRGKSYLSQISYTGHDSLSPLNTVDFELEDRPDVSFNYISTSKIVTAKRLKQIVVKQDNELGNNLVWTYDLEYDKSTDTNRSLLKSITQKTADGKSFPPQTFSYQRAND